MNERVKRNRWILIALFAVFLAPVLAAIYLNSSFSQWSPGATRNYGELIQPVLPVPGLEPLAGSGQELRWTLLLLNCRVDRSAHLDGLGRIRRALGRHEDKLVVAAAGGLVPVPAPVAVLDEVEGTLAEALASRSLPPQGVYLIDPLGNLMMRYPDAYDPGEMRKDLERLLKYSKFGPE